MSALIGNGGLISLASRLITTYPATVLMMFNQSNTNSGGTPFSQLTAGTDRTMNLYLETNGTANYATHRGLGGSQNGQAYLSFARTANTWYACRVRFNSISSVDVTIGAIANFASNSDTAADDLALHDTFTLGAGLTGMIAEVGVFDGTAVTDTAYNAYRTGSVLVENMAGVTFADSLLTIPNGATELTAETGQVMTVSGVVTQGSSHPVSRAVPDTIVPIFTGTLTPSGISTTGYTIAWSGTTRSDNVGITAFEHSVDNVNWTNIGNVLSKSFTGKTPATGYPNYVRAIDAAGNHSAPLSLTVTTAATADTVAPNLSGAITQGAITSSSSAISWPAATDNVAVDHYEVSKDGGATWIILGNVLNYTFTGLNSSTTYAQRVVAKDAAGNASPILAASVTTSAAAQTSIVTPPYGTIDSGAGQGDTAGLWPNEPMQLVVIDSDNPGAIPQVINVSTTAQSTLAPFAINHAAGFKADVRIKRVADRNFCGAFASVSA